MLMVKDSPANFHDTEIDLIVLLSIGNRDHIIASRKSDKPFNEDKFLRVNQIQVKIILHSDKKT